MIVTFHTTGWWARLRDIQSEAGFTLIELLVASAMAIILLGATLTILVTTQRVQASDAEWAQTMQAGRTGLARMAHEIRQASTIEKAEAGTIDFLATIGGTSWQIKFECGVAQSGTTYDECVRFAAEGSKSLPTTGSPTIRDVLNGTAVFAYSPSASPNVVTLKVELPAKGTLHQANSVGNTHNVVLEDAAFMRNLDPAG
jgi:type II secretory pathway pseudopilin PulG